MEVGVPPCGSCPFLLLDQQEWPLRCVISLTCGTALPPNVIGVPRKRYWQTPSFVSLPPFTPSYLLPSRPSPCMSILNSLFTAGI